MRKILTTLGLMVLGISLYAQVPQRFSYQAIIRDNQNQLVANQEIAMRISIITLFGIPVYSERHTVTTNANGLATLQIGGGAGISGNFSDINWKDITYRLKTETDPKGGFAYTITGFTDLLAVPYALEAEHATVADSIAPGRLKIGDAYQGGIIFWLDETGEHGLILGDGQNSAAWNNGADRYTGAWADGIYNGETNTTIIVIAQAGDHHNHLYAAGYCYLRSTGSANKNYGDWYLPSVTELQLLYNVRSQIPGFLSDREYWSSCESMEYVNWSEAKTFDMSVGYSQIAKKSEEKSFKCIRKF